MMTLSTFIALASLLSPFGIALALVVMGELSRRLGETMRVPPYYRGFFVAAAMMLVSGAARFVLVLAPPANSAGAWWQVALLNGLPAVALTLAVILAWRYWSWLLAERE